MHQALSQANEEWLYPRYMKNGKCNANSASVGLKKRAKGAFVVVVIVGAFGTVGC